MRGRQDGTDAAKIWTKIPDISLRNGLNGREVGQEYDGLESAELAWILGRKMITRSGINDSVSGEGVSAAAVSAHALGAGYGPDRMQRLAYQGYMEAYFRAAFGQKAIQLHSMGIVNPNNQYLVGNIREYKFLIGNAATVLDSVDVPYVSEMASGHVGPQTETTLQYSKADGSAEAATGPGGGLSTGLFVMEKGPFLRGKVVEDMPVRVHDMNTTAPNSERNPKHTMERNFGDSVAFEALYAQMRTQSFFDWSPDGMVLSKLESPAGDPYSSMEIDARQAQLYNICVQGPAIAKTWTGDYKQQVMPLDRVFIALVADVVSEIGAAKGANIDELIAANKKYTGVGPGSGGGTLAQLQSKMGTKPTPSAGKTDYEAAIDALFEAASKGDDQTAARNTLDDFFKIGGPAWGTEWDKTADQVRRGTLGAKTSVMTNFRLKRVTSSYLSQYSHFQPGKPESRCGLRIGTKAGANAASGVKVAGEYIIGAWHIGTVLDNAASRSTIGNTVRTAPASMAININVNIEWWSGDKLHRHYMDVAGQNLPRDGIAKEQEKRTKGLDVSPADIAEKRPWFVAKPRPPAAPAAPVAPVAPVAPA